MNSYRKLIFGLQIVEEIIPPDEFNIFHSTAGGDNFFNISGAVPFETISMSFDMHDFTEFESMHFESPVSVPDMDGDNVSEVGTVTINGSGTAQSLYQLLPTGTSTYCRVTITARSSGEFVGIGDFVDLFS